MLWKELTAAFVIGLLLSAAFALIIRRRGPRSGFIWLFLFLFVATWAGGVWLSPFGPALWGIYWLRFLAAGLFVTALMLLFTPKRPPHGRHETLEKLEQMEQGKEMQNLTFITLSVVFWLVFIVLVLAIVYRYAFSA